MPLTCILRAIDFIMSQIVQTLWLVNFVGRTDPLNLSDTVQSLQRYNKYLTNLVFLGPYCKLRILVSPSIYGPSASNLQYGPQTRLVKGIAS